MAHSTSSTPTTCSRARSAPVTDTVTVDPGLGSGFDRWTSCTTARVPGTTTSPPYSPEDTDVTTTASTSWEFNVTEASWQDCSGLTVTEYTDLLGTNDVEHTYQVIAVNGCGLTDATLTAVDSEVLRDFTKPFPAPTALPPVGDPGP